MITVLVIPTGKSCKECDGNPVIKLLTGCYNLLITHPNVVNASAVDKMADGTLYAKGSILDRFLNGQIDLQYVTTYNKIFITVDGITIETTSVIDTELFKLSAPLLMQDFVRENEIHSYSGVKELVESVRHMKFNALAIHTPVQVDKGTMLNYYEDGGINPWGSIEAIVSREVFIHFNKSTTHVPPESTEIFLIIKKIVPPRIIATAICVQFVLFTIHV